MVTENDADGTAELSDSDDGVVVIVFRPCAIVIVIGMVASGVTVPARVMVRFAVYVPAVFVPGTAVTVIVWLLYTNPAFGEGLTISQSELVA
jgi:hypothetical protein